MIRASKAEDLAPLVALCRDGRLFDVQEWISQGKPVALPEEAGPKARSHNPLRIAMECGNHSLVQVLLEAGAPTHVRNYNALDHAVELRRPDLAALLIKHGADATKVDMGFVLEMWHPEMVQLFLANGASLHRDEPVARALIYKMRPALGLLKRYADEPEIRRQADMALRYHANQGNTKWFSLLLWAGADPWKGGPYDPQDLDADPGEDDEHLGAIELATLGGKLDILNLRKVAAVLANEPARAVKLIESACYATDCGAFAWLLEHGYGPEALDDHGTAAINRLVYSMCVVYPVAYESPWSIEQSREGIDTSRAMERMKMVHMLLAHGAKWLPKDKEVIGDVRKSLLKMAPGYVVELVWLLQKYSAARRRDVLDLLRTPGMSRLIAKERERIGRIVAGLPEEVPGLRRPECVAATGVESKPVVSGNS